MRLIFISMNFGLVQNGLQNVSRPHSISLRLNKTRRLASPARGNSLANCLCTVTAPLTIPGLRPASPHCRFQSHQTQYSHQPIPYNESLSIYIYISIYILLVLFLWKNLIVYRPATFLKVLSTKWYFLVHN